MQKIVYLVEGKDYGKLKDMLAANPFERDSFAIVGYTLKESKPMGLKGGSYVLYFKSADPELVKKLKEKLKMLVSAKELAENESTPIISLIEEEENSATSGFGSIFG